MTPSAGPQVFAEDLVLITPGEFSLARLPALMPPGARLEVPPLPLSAQAWILAAGVGRLNARPARQDVLGLSYVSPHSGLTPVGGTVVKNVAGLNVTHFIVGLDPSLRTAITVPSVTFRLRPGPPARLRGVTLTGAPRPEDWAAPRAAGADYAYAWPLDGGWRLQGVWFDAPRPPSLAPLAELPGEGWGEPDAPPEGETLPEGFEDERGAFPRAARALSDLERRVIAAL